MKKYVAVVANVMMIVSIAFSVHAAETIAVLDFKSLMADDELGVAVAEILKTELAGIGEYTIIERGMLEQILEEQTLQLSGAVDTETAVKIGKLVGANIVVTGSVVKTGDVYTINSRFIEVETGIVKVGKNIRGQGEEQISNMVQQLALIITGKALVTETVDSEELTPNAPSAAQKEGASQKERPEADQVQSDEQPPPRFPREVMEACEDKQENDACVIKGPRREFEATCRQVQDRLACLLRREDLSKQLQKRWDEIDRNHDGFLDMNEFLDKDRQPPRDDRRPPRKD